MRSRPAVTSSLVALAFGVWLGWHGSATAQQAANHHELPASVQLEHEQTLQRLAILTRRKGAVGVAAKKAEAVLKEHMAREVDYILPPLTLLPELAEGKATPDMKWALAMTDRTKATREEIFEERARMTDALNGIIAAALPVHDNEAIAFAQDVAADVLVDTELEEPTVLLIGEYLHLKLDAAH